MEIDQDGADLRQGDLEAMPVCGFEGALQIVAIDIHHRQLDGEEMALPLKLHFGAMEGDDLLDGDGLAREQRFPFVDLRLEHAAHRAAFDHLNRRVYGLDEIMPEVGDDAAEGVGDARPRRNQNARDGELARQRGRMQGTSTAEGEEGKIPWG